MHFQTQLELYSPPNSNNEFKLLWITYAENCLKPNSIPKQLINFSSQRQLSKVTETLVEALLRCGPECEQFSARRA